MNTHTKQYAVEVRLGDGEWFYSASYATIEKALKVVESWKGRRGAVHNEPFDARLKEKS